MKNILIIGAGHGGYAAAGDLLLKGFEVKIYDLPEYQANLFPLIENKKVKLTGEISGVVTAPIVEINIEEAISTTDIILIISHSSSHKKVAEMIAPFIKDNQIIVLLPGYTGGTLCFEKIFKEKQVSSSYILAETNTLPYACSKITGESAVHIKLYVKQLLVSTFPSKYNTSFLKVFKKLYPNAQLVDNVLEVGFNNGNPVLNILPCLFNAGKIEQAKGDYYHFQEGVTPAIAKVLEKLDGERMLIGKALGIRVIPYLDRVMDTGYVTDNSSWYEMISTSPHLTAKGPDSLNHRYLTEDVPFGLVPWVEFSRKLKVEVPLMGSCIELASCLLEKNFWESGRTLEEMGIKDMSIDQLLAYLKVGSQTSFIHSTK
ncbi:MAG: NAD/NADP octopine/nopaline dehydrogenase family protein [Bacillus sp. (in: Bacteria)]|nr:NAD/NADP octopine/nopaline dehydrogenase family protein [Bacillus sp. (in: firmicutes)]